MAKTDIPQAIRFLVYDADGKILRSGVCSAADMELQARPGQRVMHVKGRIDDRFQEVHEGDVREIPGIRERLEALKAAQAAAEEARRKKVLAGDIDAANSLDEVKQALKVLLGARTVAAAPEGNSEVSNS